MDDRALEGLWSTPITLRAMTLRGLGSYFRGAKLEFRPLTMLCGMNGSGKSTWALMLEAMRRAVGSGKVPFLVSDRINSLPREDYWGPEGPGLINAALNELASDRETRSELVKETVGSPEDRTKFGAPGTVGFEFLVRRSCNVNSPIVQAAELGTDSIGGETPGPMAAAELFARFLQSGECKRGWKIRVRLTLWRAMVPTLLDSAEIDIGGIGRLRTWPSLAEDGKRHDIGAYFEPAGGTPSRLGTILVDADAHFSAVDGSEGSDAEHPLTAVFHNFPLRVRDLVRVATNCCFHIGPLRDIHAYDDVPAENFERLKTARARYVGERGEHTFALLQQYGGERLRQPKPPHHAMLRREAYDVPHHASKALLLALEAKPDPHAGAADVTKTAWSQSLELANAFVTAKISGWCPPLCQHEVRHPLPRV